MPDEGPETDDWFNPNDHKDPESMPFVVMQGIRMNHFLSANTRIQQYGQNDQSLQLAREYLDKLLVYANNDKILYGNEPGEMDCSRYTFEARNKKGYHGSTTNFCQHCKYYGHVDDIGGYDMLLPGMELYQAWRNPSDNRKFTTAHTGVYAGFHDFGNGPEPAVYQSSGSYGSLARMNTRKSSGPNLTAMNDRWNYWGWSKYIRADETTHL